MENEDGVANKPRRVRVKESIRGGGGKKEEMLIIHMTIIPLNTV